MRSKILFALIAFVGLMNVSFASNNPETDLRHRVTDLIKTEVLSQLSTDASVELKIQFMINEDQQIRVIAVNSNNETINKMVFDKLDYATISAKDVFTKFHYNLTVNFINKKA